VKVRITRGRRKGAVTEMCTAAAKAAIARGAATPVVAAERRRPPRQGAGQRSAPPKAEGAAVRPPPAPPTITPTDPPARGLRGFAESLLGADKPEPAPGGGEE
jgi:hypothetical protein